MPKSDEESLFKTSTLPSSDKWWVSPLSKQNLQPQQPTPSTPLALSQGMWIWALSFGFFFAALLVLGKDCVHFVGNLGVGRHKKNLEKVAQVLRELEETLMAGLVPSSDRWDSLKSLVPPWGSLASESVSELRTAGGSLLPTLQRLRALSEEQTGALVDASAKASQALTQALACGLLVPLLGVSLYFILPGIEARIGTWIAACGISLVWTGVGSLWLLHLAEVARWGGIKAENRSWILSSQCTGERFLALVRSGTPPDLAWVKACEFLSRSSKTLAGAWGYSLWQAQPPGPSGKAEQILVAVGVSIRKTVQVSLMEGRPCTERIEGVLSAMRHDMKALTDRELSLLTTRALKPLFVCVAPALLGLLACGLWIASIDAMAS